MHDLGRTLLALGVLLAVVGAALMLLPRLGGIPLGRLPGDIVWRRDGFAVYVPIATSILVSIVLSVVLYLLRR
jgi:hypothetical protein